MRAIYPRWLHQCTLSIYKYLRRLRQWMTLVYLWFDFINACYLPKVISLVIAIYLRVLHQQALSTWDDFINVRYLPKMTRLHQRCYLPKITSSMYAIYLQGVSGRMYSGKIEIFGTLIPRYGNLSFVTLIVDSNVAFIYLLNSENRPYPSRIRKWSLSRYFHGFIY